MVYGRVEGHIRCFCSRATRVPAMTPETYKMPEAVNDHCLELIQAVYWLRLGGPEIKYGAGAVPQMPSDILGVLSDGQWFYYKDCDPTMWGGGGVMHPYYVFYIAYSLSQLLQSLSQADRRNFFRQEQWWHAGDQNPHENNELQKCTCPDCVCDRRLGRRRRRNH